MTPRVCLFALPPCQGTTPSPVLGYLKGYVEAQSPEIRVETFHWNQSIPETCLGRDWLSAYHSAGDQEAFGEDYTTFWRALFHGCYQRFLGKVDASHPLYGAGAISMADHSVASFLRAVEDVCGYIDAEIEAQHLETCDIYGCSTRHFQLIPSLTLLSRLKRANPRALAVLGGLVMWEALPLMDAFPFVDCCVVGEGEHVLHAICKQHPRYDFSSVPGLVFRQDGVIRSNDPVPFPGDIDTAWADYSGFDWAAAEAIRIPIWDSRGCPWNRCTWCAFSKDASECFAERSPASIAAEARHHLVSMGPTQYQDRPVDLALTGNNAAGSGNKRFASILRELLRLRDEVCPHLYVRGDICPTALDEETSRLLNGLSGLVYMGFEHFSDTMLELMNKSHRVVHSIRALKLLERNPRVAVSGIQLIAGYPGETLLEVGEAIRNLYSLRLVLNSLVKNRQLAQIDIAKGIGAPVDIVEVALCPRSPFGSAYDYDNPLIRALVCTSVTYRALTSMMSDGELCRTISMIDGLYNMPDVTATRRLLRIANQRLSKACIAIEQSCYLSPEGFPTIRFTYGDEQVEVVFDDEVHRKLLQLTDDVIALEELFRALDAHSNEKVQQVISDLRDAGFLFVDKQRAINTLPWQLQQMINVYQARG